MPPFLDGIFDSMLLPFAFNFGIEPNCAARKAFGRTVLGTLLRFVVIRTRTYATNILEMSVD